MEELEKKEYIQRTERGYRLTVPKGIAAALTLFKEIEESGIDELSIILERVERVDEQLGSVFKEIWMIYSEIYPKKEYYQELLKATKMLLDEGLDMDAISNVRFNSCLELKLEEMLQKEILQKERREIVTLKPELYRRILQTFQKTKNLYLEKMKEFEVASNSVEESLRKLSNAKRENIGKENENSFE